MTKETALDDRTTCRTCGNTVATNATACPHCGDSYATPSVTASTAISIAAKAVIFGALLYGAISLLGTCSAT